MITGEVNMQTIKLWIKNKDKPHKLYTDDETIMDFTDFMVNAKGKSTFHFQEGERHFLVFRNALQGFEIDYSEGKDE